VLQEADRFYPQARPAENRFKVTIAADVPPGIYEVRAAGPYGISTARRFVVGDREEILEKEPNNTPETANDIGVGQTVSGTCDPQNFDHFRFQAKKGQRYVVECLAQRIDSRARLVAILMDASGHKLQYAAATQYNDPVLDVVAPADGPLVVRVNDLTFRGGDEYFYRITVTTGPWIDFVDPPVLRPGEDNQVTLYGRNLPGGAPAEGLQIDGRSLEKLVVTIKGPSNPAAGGPATETLLRPVDVSIDAVSYRLPSPSGYSNPVRLLVGDEPLVREVEPNNDLANAQAVKPPVQIVGTFNPRGDRDSYIFEAAKGEKLWIELFGQRLGLPLDPVMVIQQVSSNEKGELSAKDLLEVDDQPTPIPAQGGMEKRYRMGSEDPAVLWTAPSDGKFRVVVRDQYGQGDPRFVYRLVIRPPKPDFRLVAFPVESIVDPQNNQKSSPWTCVARRGGADHVRIVAFRREGFSLPIRVEAEGLPPGVTARPVVMGPTDTVTEFVLQVAADAPAFAGSLRLTGVAEVAGKPAARPVRSAELLWNVADPQKDTFVTRVTDQLAFAVDAHFTAPFSAQLGDGSSYRMVRGGKLKIPVKLVKNQDFKEIEKAQVKLVPTGLPNPQNTKPIAVKELTLDLKKPDGELEMDVTEKAPLGQFSFYVSGEVIMPYVHDPERVRQLEEDKKRIDGLVPQVAEEAKQAAAALAKAEQEHKEAAAALAKAKSAGQAEAVIKEAEEKMKAAEEAKAKAADQDAKAKELVKLGATYQKKLADDLKKSTDGMKEKKLKVWVASLPVSVDIVAAPLTLKLPAEAVALKVGEKAEVTVDLVREFGFADEAKLELVAPGGVAIKLADPVTVGAKDTAGKLTLVADKNAKPGSYTLTLRAQIKFNQKAVTVEASFPVQLSAGAGS
jgi:hypothetical protein